MPIHKSFLGALVGAAAVIAASCGAGGAGPSGSGGSGGGNGGAGGGLPSQIQGITVDDITGIDTTVSAIRGLPTKPMTRVVFDPGQGPIDYLEAVTKIHSVSYIMGQPVDSDGLKNLTLAQYRTRFTEYLDAFRGQVDVWEIGNEINGDWTGATSDIVAKTQAAFTETKARQGKTALTLYYNIGCADDPTRQMLEWSSANIPSEIKQGIDYVLVSYYPDDCAGAAPNWKSIFGQLSSQYPNALVGFGEIGTQRPEAKAQMIRDYYNMAAPVPKWIGGYFWWWFKEDAVPTDKPLWSVFRQVMSGN